MASLPMVAGGAMSETTLWTNPNTSVSFASTDVTLSESIQNYTHIKVYVAFGNAAAGQLDIVWSILMPVSDFLGATTSGASGRQLFTPTEITQGGGFRYRNAYYKGDTTVGFSQCYESGTAKNQQLIPLRIAGVKKGSSGTGNTIKSAIYDKVFNGGFTEITTLTPFQSRITLNEGKIVADTVNHIVYVYVDVTTNTSFGSASDWSALFALDSTMANYLPVFTANNRQNIVPLITDETSAVSTKAFFCGYASQSSAYRLGMAYGQTANSGERYILYTAYTYK